MAGSTTTPEPTPAEPGAAEAPSPAAVGLSKRRNLFKRREVLGAAAAAAVGFSCQGVPDLIRIGRIGDLPTSPGGPIKPRPGWWLPTTTTSAPGSTTTTGSSVPTTSTTASMPTTTLPPGPPGPGSPPPTPSPAAVPRRYHR
jgi:hypothetical protein